jgi:hypothetical protein
MISKKQTIHETTQASPLNTVFGGGFLPENHMEAERRNLPAPDSRFADFVKSLRDLVSVERP